MLDLNNKNFGNMHSNTLGSIDANRFESKVQKPQLSGQSTKNCLFCSIIKKDLPANIVFENQYLVAFKDIKPVAPIHILLVPKTHIENLNDVTTANSIYIAQIFEAIPSIVKKIPQLNDGYKVVSNIGENGGQNVNHLHFHIVGGKKLGSNIIHNPDLF